MGLRFALLAVLFLTGMHSSSSCGSGCAHAGAGHSGSSFGSSHAASGGSADRGSGSGVHPVVAINHGGTTVTEPALGGHAVFPVRPVGGGYRSLGHQGAGGYQGAGLRVEDLLGDVGEMLATAAGTGFAPPEPGEPGDEPGPDSAEAIADRLAHPLQCRSVSDCHDGVLGHGAVCDRLSHGGRGDADDVGTCREGCRTASDCPAGSACLPRLDPMDPSWLGLPGRRGPLSQAGLNPWGGARAVAGEAGSVDPGARP